MKKLFTVIVLLLLAVIILFLAYAAITFPPVMAGMASKTMCSCTFIGGRTMESVRQKELKVFPGLSDASITINMQDSSVEATVFWRTSRSIYRKGLGCTLLADLSEREIRAKRIDLAPLPPTDSLSWPTEALFDSLHPQSIDQRMIEAALDKAFEEVDPERPKNTAAVVVVHNGKIVGERYGNGWDRNDKLMGWSMTKSVTSALIGILVHEGKLKVDAGALVSEWANDERKNVTLNNLLQATSGLSWSESYFVPTSHFHNMFIRSDDKAGYAASLKLKFKPGERFEYSSGTTNILSRMIRHTVGDALYYRFPYERLFYKIGMNHTMMEPDGSGTFVGSSYCYGTARDWAKFGLLYLNDGVWNGERILPEGWVKYTTTPSAAAERGEYGAQWHLNAGAKGNPENRKLPGLPTDAYWADGFEEQWVMVIPSHHLVVVRLGVSHHGFDFTGLVNNILSAIKEEL